MKRLAALFLPSAGDSGEPGTGGLFRYRRLWLLTVVVTSVFAVTPLLILMGVNYHQFERSLEVSIEREIDGLLAEKTRSLEWFLEERTALLRFVIRDRVYSDLSDQATLAAVYDNLKVSAGGFVDVGVYDAKGRLVCWVGGGDRTPGTDYSGQEWFRKVWETGTFVSDVFLGYRNYPHFVIAVASTSERGEEFVLRATFDAKVLADLVQPHGADLSTDIFMVNRGGVLQTPSRYCGANVLDPCPAKISRPPDASIWQEDVDGDRKFFGWAEVAGSPYVFVVVKEPDVGGATYFSRRGELLGFTIVSMIVIVLLLMAMASYLVYRIREADLKRAKVLHNIEYTSKMASLGRLAAGVAHEINNPLAIINEKAGLLRDLLELNPEGVDAEKRVKLVDSVLSQVDRCRTITHRLLGFAKRMDVQMESLRLDTLLTEVLSFLAKEAETRNVRIECDFPADFPTIRSDRGQLQQVFLNVLNNAFQAVDDGGRVDIGLAPEGEEAVAVTIRDDGCGIGEEDLKHIFEPFFTTKKTYGTGLGLSITYGIVEKLGGRIEVESAVGEGTTFRIVLPVAGRSPA